jgi:hypothetical protein
VFESGVLRLWYRCWEVEREEMGLEAWDEGGEDREPVVGEESEKSALVGYALWFVSIGFPQLQSTEALTFSMITS